MTRPQFLARLLRRWHKRLGLLAAALIAFLALSGLAINHGETLKLDTVEVDAPWLMNWYGLKAIVPERAFPLETAFFCAQGDIWMLGDQRLPPGHGEPVGAVSNDAFFWIASAEQIRLYDRQGRAIDSIGRDLLPATPIQRLGRHDQDIVVAAAGNFYTSGDGVAWQKLVGEDKVQWSRPVALSEAQQQRLAPFFAPRLPLQRIVADLHSGRIFGHYGILATDLLAAILLVLAASGAWLYLGEKARKKAPRPQHQPPR